MINKVYFWEPTLSPHKIDLYKAIKRNYPHIEIEVIYKEEISNNRKSLGWKIEPTVPCRMVDDPFTVKSIVDSSDDNSVHCICGVRQSNLPASIIDYAERGSIKFVLMAETKAIEGLKGLLRKLHFYTFKRNLISNARLLFAQGRLAPDWYISVGLAPSKIVNFGYYVDRSYSSSGFVEDESNVFKIGYLGRITVDKGILILLNSFKELSIKRRDKFQLIIRGVGEKKLEGLINRYKSNYKVDWSGSISYPEVQSFMNELDLLVVPSITSNDGWGVVVNEALISGIPVLCSYKVGSSVIVEKNPLFGIVFNKLVSSEITRKVIDISESSLYSRRMNEMRSTLSQPFLSPDAAAHSFVRSIESSFKNYTEIKGMW